MHCLSLGSGFAAAAPVSFRRDAGAPGCMGPKDAGHVIPESVCTTIFFGSPFTVPPSKQQLLTKAGDGDPRRRAYTSGRIREGAVGVTHIGRTEAL